MMNLFHPSDNFYIATGDEPIVIGAPHHGSLPNRKADRGTGPIAQAVAAYLHGGVVVVSDLRSRVDVNKDPLALDKSVRAVAFRYQNALFSGQPSLVIEIHGHTTGRYDIEVSTGFELDPGIYAEAEYMEKLVTLKQSMKASLNGHTGQHPSVGVWPVDRDVVKTATNTFTFQKVRRARHIAGLNWFGLHIELSPGLRLRNGSRSGQVQPLPAQLVHAVSGALADAISKAFLPLPRSANSIPLIRENGLERQTQAEQRIKISRVPGSYGSDNLVVIHPDTLHQMGALEGDTVIVQGTEEELASQLSTSMLVHKGEAGISQRMRNQVGVKPGQWVTLYRPNNHSPAAHAQVAAAGVLPAMVANQFRLVHPSSVWLSGADLEKLGLKPGESTRVVGRSGLVDGMTSSLQVDNSLPIHAAAISQDLATHMGITLGETLCLEQEEHAFKDQVLIR